MSDFTIRPFCEREAAQVAAWAYEPPYNIYNGDLEHPEDYLAVDFDGYGYYAVARVADDDVVGFCCFGAEARVKGQEPETGTLDVGGGVRPDLVSQGLATELFPLILDFARDRFSPRRFRTAVASFNERSIRLCASAGFQVVREFNGPEREFKELVRPAR